MEMLAADGLRTIHKLAFELRAFNGAVVKRE